MSYFYCPEFTDDFDDSLNEGIMLEKAIDSFYRRHERRVNEIELGINLTENTLGAQCDEYRTEQYLYTEGVKEVWEKIKAFFRKIIDKIRSKIDPNYTANVQVEDPSNAINLIRIANDLVANIANVRGPDGTLDPEKLARRLGVGVVTGLTAKKAVQMAIDKLEHGPRHKGPIKALKSVFDNAKRTMSEATKRMGKSNMLTETELLLIQQLYTSGAKGVDQAMVDAVGKKKSKGDTGLKFSNEVKPFIIELQKKPKYHEGTKALIELIKDRGLTRDGVVTMKEIEFAANLAEDPSVVTVYNMLKKSINKSHKNQRR